MTPMPLPTIESYASYRGRHYGAHAIRVRLGDWTFWFSYTTLVAFQYRSGLDEVFAVRRNTWGPTTEKHLKQIDGGGRSGAQRMGTKEFLEAWDRAAALCRKQQEDPPENCCRTRAGG